MKKNEVHFHYEGGIQSYVEYLNENKTVIFEPAIFTEGEMDGIAVEVAMQYTDTYHSVVMSFANNINTHEGGTHEQGFRTALTRVINNYAKQNKILKENEDNLTGDDVREGLTAVISVKHPNPQFEGQTKTKLGNSEVTGIVNKLFAEALTTFMLENPQVARKIVEKGILASKARIAAKRAREVTRKKNQGLKFPTFPVNWLTVHQIIQNKQNYSSSKEIRLEVRLNQDVIVNSKQFYLFVVRF